MIRIGANPIIWSNDDMPKIGGKTSLDTCLSEAKLAGFEGMELGTKFPRKAEKLGPILAAKGLSLVSGWYSTALLQRGVKAEMKAIRDHLDLLKALGAKVLIASETSNSIHPDRKMPLSARPVLPSRDWKQFGARLTELSERVRDEGMQLVYHHHMGTVVQSEAEIDRLMEVTGDAMHLLLDSGHATWGGGDAARIARHYRPRISHMHVKDVREEVMWQSQRKDWSFLDSVLAGVYTVPGDGFIDYVSILKQFKGYDGWIVIEAEQDPEKANPFEYSKLGVKNLKALMKKAGL